jgi:hypothetical protein
MHYSSHAGSPDRPKPKMAPDSGKAYTHRVRSCDPSFIAEDCGEARVRLDSPDVGFRLCAASIILRGFRQGSGSLEFSGRFGFVRGNGMRPGARRRVRSAMVKLGVVRATRLGFVRLGEARGLLRVSGSFSRGRLGFFRVL